MRSFKTFREYGARDAVIVGWVTKKQNERKMNS